MSADRSRRLLLLLVPLAVVACSDDGGGPGDDAAAATSSAAASASVVQVAPEEDIYALADDLQPGEPGDVIAVQEVPGVDIGGTVLRVLHHSRSLEGEDIAVSGLIVSPTGEAPSGGRPVLSWAHGTTGIADECAPSKDRGSLSGLAEPFLERGMVVAATDYEGLGTPGRHPYIAGESEGRGTLDIVRAARNLQERTGASERVVIWGHSQGGRDEREL
jgi:hypothetical protein